MYGQILSIYNTKAVWYVFAIQNKEVTAATYKRITRPRWRYPNLRHNTAEKSKGALTMYNYNDISNYDTMPNLTDRDYLHELVDALDDDLISEATASVLDIMGK